MQMDSFPARLVKFAGFNKNTVSNCEKLVSTLGGTIGIFLIAYVSYKMIGADDAVLIVPSMGASAVLLFAVPHGKLSQPWALFGGQIISAVIGVACYQWIPDIFLAAGLAVGLSIGAMHLTGCVHPPGGATALVAVIGSPAIHALGYQYVITPILLNTLIIFFTAVIFNSFFPWRRYPASLMQYTDTPPLEERTSSRYIDKKYIERALSDIDLVVDLNASDLQQLFALALEHAETPEFAPSQIKLGHYYTNSQHGAEWTVRQIIDETSSDDPEKDMVIYRVVEGRGLRSANSCTRTEFARWAVRELFPANKSQETSI